LNSTSVYAVLDRLEQKGFVDSEYNEGHKYYKVTEFGDQTLKTVQEYRENLKKLEEKS
jgi:DNA-binding PadR family transcriptional regulator